MAVRSIFNIQTRQEILDENSCLGTLGLGGGTACRVGCMTNTKSECKHQQCVGGKGDEPKIAGGSRVVMHNDGAPRCLKSVPPCKWRLNSHKPFVLGG